MNTRLSRGVVSGYKLRGHEQNGTIMIVALVLLFVVTLLAMSGLKTASVQERMALNAQTSNVAFQHAESAVNSVLWQMQNGNRALVNEVDAQVSARGVFAEGSVEFFEEGDPDAVTTVQVILLGAAGPGDGETRGREGLASNRYDIVGVSEIATTGASATVTQGIILN